MTAAVYPYTVEYSSVLTLETQNSNVYVSVTVTGTEYQ